MSPRKIIHLDLDAFFCAVEEQRDPALRGKAFAVGGQPDERGVVASCSYPARRFGVRSAMPMSQALRRCPGLLIVSHHFDLYHDASERVMAILHDLTPVVEQISIDEAFLDVTGPPESVETIARRLQAEIISQTALPCSLGAATNKLVAKIANNIGKGRTRGDSPPNAITVVPPGEEAAFLAPLSAGELWGVGPRTLERLESLGIGTIGDIASWPEADLARRFGKHGAGLARHARGIDERPVETSRETKSVSAEITFSRDVNDGEVLRETLRAQCEEVGRRLRRAALAGTTIQLKMRWPDFTTITRQVTLRSPVNLDSEIYDAALSLFQQHWRPAGRRVRLIGVGVSGFSQRAVQISLFDAETDKGLQLQDALDDLRDRFGERSVRRGSALKRRRGGKE